MGHTLRKDMPNVTHQALDWNPQGKGERPKQAWCTVAKYQSSNLTWQSDERYAKDRRRWKQTVVALYTPQKAKRIMSYLEISYNIYMVISYPYSTI